MKHKLILLLALTFITAQTACKKDDSTVTPELEDDGLADEGPAIMDFIDDHKKLETGEFKKLLDTNSLEPVAKYVVLFKKDFQPPLAEVYTGSDDDKESAASANERNAKVKIKNQFKPGLINDTNVLSWYSVLSSGFYAELKASEVKEIYRDDNVKCVALAPEYITEGTPVYTYGTEPLFVHGYKSASASTKIIWIIDTGCDPDATSLRVNKTHTQSFVGGSVKDNSEHGSYVAHIAGAKEYGTDKARGTAEGAQIVMLKAGSGTSFTWDGLNKALEYCWIHSKRGDIVNMSLSVNSAGVNNATKAAITELENNILDFKGWDMPFTIAGGNQATLASNRSPARLGLKYKDDPVNYKFIHVVANIQPVGTETQIKNATCTFKLNDDYSSNYGRAIRWGLLGTWMGKNAAGIIDVGSGTSYSAPALAGILYNQSNSMNMPATLTNVVKYKKGSTSYTHLVPKN